MSGALWWSCPLCAPGKPASPAPQCTCLMHSGSLRQVPGDRISNPSCLTTALASLVGEGRPRGPASSAGRVTACRGGWLRGQLPGCLHPLSPRGVGLVLGAHAPTELVLCRAENSSACPAGPTGAGVWQGWWAANSEREKLKMVRRAGGIRSLRRCPRPSAWPGTGGRTCQGVRVADGISC